MALAVVLAVYRLRGDVDLSDRPPTDRRPADERRGRSEVAR